jgi:hypothetical protein
VRERRLHTLTLAGLAAAALFALFAWPRDRQLAPDATPALTDPRIAGAMRASPVPPTGADDVEAGVLMPETARVDALLVRFSEAQQELFETRRDLAPPIQAAWALRLALERQGYDAQRTLLYWMSPEFQREASSKTVGEGLAMKRSVQNLLSMAFGDGLADAEFRQILAVDSPDVRAAAQRRRGGE